MKEVSEEPVLESIKSKSEAEGKTCLICFERPSDAVFLECGHGGRFSFLKE